MATGLTTYGQNAILNLLFRGTSLTPPSGLYVALHSADPGLTGANEISGNGYARKQATFNAPVANGSYGRKVESAASVLFDKATPSGWGAIGHFSVWDAASGGNCISTGALTESITVLANQKPEFEAGSFYIGLEQKT